MEPAPPSPKRDENAAAKRKRRDERRAKRDQEPAERSLKETLESVVVAFILAFTFRVYVTEAYIIPTGSMAPTLLGSHVEADCPACGFRVVSDASPLLERAIDSARCPMCFFDIPLEEAPGLPPAIRSGDRILVQKFLGRFEAPDRFDVVVFKNPQNPFGGGQNFIKRLTGLPDERLMLLDGNVYVAPEPEEAGVPDERLRWRIARKTDEDQNPRAEAIQRSVFQPVWHSRFWPRDGGTAGGTVRWMCPWVPAEGHWTVGPEGFSPAPAGFDEDRFALRFDFTPVPGLPGYLRPDAIYPYNQLGYGPGDLDVFEDFRVAVTLRPAGSADRGVFEPLEAAVRGTARLSGGLAEVRVRFGNGFVWLETRTTESGGPWTRLAAADAGDGLPPLAEHPRLEFWSVDQELSAWIDGACVLRYRIDVGFEALLTRPGPPRPADQTLQVSLTGPGAAAAAVVDLDLDRDLFHESGSLGNFRGGVSRGLNGLVRRDRVEPVRLAADRFFLIGDNSPQSDDSRRWSSVDTWIRARYFPGVSTKDAAGRVPRGLLIGRAFAVYYPAAKPLRPGGAAIVPDVAAMRRID